MHRVAFVLNPIAYKNVCTLLARCDGKRTSRHPMRMPDLAACKSRAPFSRLNAISALALVTRLLLALAVAISLRAAGQPNILFVYTDD